MRNWLLYVELVSNWGVQLNAFTWLTRGNELRAQASAGHSLALGYLLAVGFSFWLYLKSHVDGRVQRIGTTVLLWGGLFAAFSRGPWLGAVTAYFTFFRGGQTRSFPACKKYSSRFIRRLIDHRIANRR